MRLTLELSSVSIHFCRGLAESDSASQSEKKSGGRQIFEHLPILSRLRRLRGLHAAAGDMVSSLRPSAFFMSNRAVTVVTKGKSTRSRLYGRLPAWLLPSLVAPLSTEQVEQGFGRHALKLVEIGIGERIDCGIGRRRAPDGALAPIIRVVLMAANASSTRRTAHGLSWIRADRTALRVMTAISTAVKTGAPSGVPRSSAARRLRDMVWANIVNKTS